MKVFYQTLIGILDLLYPRICFGCNIGISEEESVHICNTCRESIRKNEAKRCYKCGLILGLGAYSSDKGCSECKKINLRFERGFFVSDYTGPLREVIIHYKYHKQEMLAKPLAELMIKKLLNEGVITEIDVLVPVPLHWKKKLSRGFNQSELFAKRISKELQIPISVNNLSNCKHTLSQTRLSRSERNKNVSGAFAVRKPELFLKKRILLIDDVLTTGITASECARILKKAGAKKVFLLALARAKL
ncbi:MAG: amidophosphoribosyltransferase [Candidatus Scalindua sp.]|nr:ComF family protein [Planctomycetota bacterium]GJQ60500.1 MAG: amidophosphoribosyltransferase [Candidatus Scalindua sp.]